MALMTGSVWGQTSQVQATVARAKALELDTPYVPPPGERSSLGPIEVLDGLWSSMRLLPCYSSQSNAFAGNIFEQGWI